MKVDGTNRRTIWPLPEHSGVTVIDQRALPHRWQLLDLRDLPSVEHAIRDMAVRGAPLIGVTAAYGLALQANRDASAAGL
ncbi:MAG: S-methyl-5-thioribose-1-phosphate isomerase, partial [Burkholderiaceae bacterium]|nr:S-methyl-5-thioribose-1-phosphate isomerase [Burkholderiaceae bacterium]